MQYAKYRPLFKRIKKWFMRAYPAALRLAVSAVVGTASGTWLPGRAAAGAAVSAAVPYFREIWVFLYLVLGATLYALFCRRGAGAKTLLALYGALTFLLVFPARSAAARQRPGLVSVYSHATCHVVCGCVHDVEGK